MYDGLCGNVSGCRSSWKAHLTFNQENTGSSPVHPTGTMKGKRMNWKFWKSPTTVKIKDIADLVAEAPADRPIFSEKHKQRLRLWVAELRSGKYEQGRGYLCTIKTGGDDAGSEKLCCLEVANRVAFDNGIPVPSCEVNSLEREGQSTDLGFLIYKVDKTGWGQVGGVMLPEVAEWYGFTGGCPHISPNMHAIEANDHHHLTFLEIADRIETYYELNS